MKTIGLSTLVFIVTFLFASFLAISHNFEKKDCDEVKEKIATATEDRVLFAVIMPGLFAACVFK